MVIREGRSVAELTGAEADAERLVAASMKEHVVL
jgi:hypothetical protein